MSKFIKASLLEKYLDNLALTLEDSDAKSFELPVHTIRLIRNSLSDFSYELTDTDVKSEKDKQ